MNTSGNIRMYHIPGSTPEAHTVEMAFNGKAPKREVMIGEAMLKKAYETLNCHTDDNVDLVYLGCPHLNIVDLMMLVRKLEGKKCKVPLWIMTAPWLYEAAKGMGYLKIIQDSGAVLMTGTCPAAMGGVPKGVRTLAVDSAKQSYYITRLLSRRASRRQLTAPRKTASEAAFTGKWRGEWK
jgi:predicted aconitase